MPSTWRNSEPILRRSCRWSGCAPASPPNVVERPYQRGQEYFAFLDPSGGAGDSFTLAIAHVDHGRNMLVLDCIREARPPFSPEHVANEFSQVMRSYNCLTGISDKYGGQWVVEQFASFRYHPRTVRRAEVAPVHGFAAADQLGPRRTAR